MKKIYFHIGHGKTGSSYLQSRFALSAELLHEYGIYYPLSGEGIQKALAGRVSTGNFPPPKGHQYHPDGMLSSVYLDAVASSNGLDKLLLSNEDLFRSINQFKFLEQVRRLIPEVECHFLLFVRDPLDHALSAYQQLLKSNQISYPEELLIKYSIPNGVQRVVRAIKDLGCTIKTVNYRNYRSELMVPVADWLEVPHTMFQKPEAESVNRSLTRTEMELQRAFNKHIGRKARVFMADALSNALPDIRSEKPYVSPDALAVFLNRMEGLILDVNKLLPKSEMYRVPSLDEALADLPNESEKDRFVLTSAQIEVIASSIASFFNHPSTKLTNN